jgi:predicted dehydrogenase
LKFAVVGLGNATRTIHLPALRKLSDVKCVGCYDERPQAGVEGIPFFTSLNDMLDQTKPDFLVIATPPDSHFDLARRGLTAGCHVFCEKPLTESLGDADELARIAKQHNRHVVVNSEFPWMPIHASAKRRMGQPGFGKLMFASMHQTFLVTPETEKGWRGLDQNRTFKEFGTHVLDLAKFFFDATPTSIRARMPKPAGPDAPDHLNIVELAFPGDRYAHILLDRLSKGRHRYLDIRLDGAEATIETSIGGRMNTTVGLNARTRRPFIDVDVAMGGRARLYRGEAWEHLATAPLDLFADATARLLTDAMQAIERGETPPSSLAHARNTLALLLACYESATDGLPRQVAE